MGKPTFLTAREAAGELGISLATLYAYVSRGLIRSEVRGGKPRERHYHAEDIQRLKQRKEQRRNPAKTAEQALSWGLPVLESSLTLISDGHLFYRGKDATYLALNSSLEEVASLLWEGEDRKVPTERLAGSPAFLSSGFHKEGLTGMHALQAALIQAESQDPTAYDLRLERVARKGFFILNLLASIAAGINFSTDTEIARILQVGWAPTRLDAVRLINAALILCADHELNVSAFTARCVASAGSSPYGAVLAGLAALQGIKHGGVTRQVEALFQEVGSPNQAQAVLSRRLKRGEPIPGFGHPLYPEGDPRARLLLDLLGNTAIPSERELAAAITEQTLRLMGDLPTIDFALVYLARGLELPEDAAIMIFALGRTVGWIAHAIEQYHTNSLIRPRARYIGAQP